MAYTVKKLAEISGVSVRTLHFYDEIELLKPAYYGANGYRYYEEKELLKLQQILFFRELGLELQQIQKILGRSDFDQMAALMSHRKILEKDLERTKKLIKTIDETIKHLKGRKKMKEEELFYGLDSSKQKEYEQYLVKSGKISIADMAKSRETTKYWSKEDWKNFHENGKKICLELVDAMQKNLNPTSSQVQQLIRRHYETCALFWTPTKDSFIGLTKLYEEHPDFRQFYSKIHPELMDFLVKGMKAFAEKEL